MTNAAFDRRAAAVLAEIDASGQSKAFRALQGPMGATVRLAGGPDSTIVLCSNDYLGLAHHPAVVAAGHRGLDRYGAGTASVRFICGTLEAHRALEADLARISGTRAALSYVSAWNANAAVLSTPTTADDVIISDELNHASIIDGCRLSKAVRAVYRHGDLDDLRAKLREHRERAIRWVVTDGVFSMEGSIADLPALLALCREEDAILIVDDSHGVGVLGATGKGTVEHFGLLGEVDVLTGTLGKALGGGAGGYVAGSERLVEILEQRARPSLFSNALPATIACSAREAIAVMEREPERLLRLRANATALREGLRARGFAASDGASAIIPIIVGEAAEAQRMSARLLELGVWVVAFSFPVVPKGAARLRLQASAALTDEHVAEALDAFAQL